MVAGRGSRQCTELSRQPTFPFVSAGRRFGAERRKATLAKSRPTTRDWAPRDRSVACHPHGPCGHRTMCRVRRDTGTCTATPIESISVVHVQSRRVDVLRRDRRGAGLEELGHRVNPVAPRHLSGSVGRQASSSAVASERRRAVGTYGTPTASASGRSTH